MFPAATSPSLLRIGDRGGLYPSDLAGSQGDGDTMNGSDLIQVPPPLRPEFVLKERVVVRLEDLYVGLRPREGGDPVYVPVEATPHYAFVRHHFHGKPSGPVAGYADYGEYARLHSDACSESEFVGMAEDLRANGYDWEHRPILVFRHWSRPWPWRRWDVADGFHRLAVLAALGMSTVPAAALTLRKSLKERVKARVMRVAGRE